MASRLSTHRNVNGAVGAFNAARKVAHGSQPEKIFADGLNAYPQAMTWWESESGKPELVARMGVGKPHANNNRIERLNGTLRERVKVQTRMEEHEDPARGRAENPIQLRQAPHGSGRTDPRSSGWSRNRGRKQVDGIAQEVGQTILGTPNRFAMNHGSSHNRVDDVGWEVNWIPVSGNCVYESANAHHGEYDSEGDSDLPLPACLCHSRVIVLHPFRLRSLPEIRQRGP